MAEEKKAQDEAAQKKEPPPNPAVPTAVAPAAAETAAGETKAKETRPIAKKEKPANCAGCNKSIRKKRWYYRNGKFYCSKSCWESVSKKEAKTEAPQTSEKK